MRKFLLIGTIGFVLALIHTTSSAQDFSNKGKEFWLSYSYHVSMVNTNNGGLPVMTLYITSDVTTTYTVEIFGVTTVSTGTISAGQVVTVTIPNNYFIDNEGLFKNRAIRVTSAKPVVVYSYITRSAISGATLCLPTAVLGREYVSMNYTQVSNETNSNSYFTIVAVEDNTTVEIVPSANTKNNWLAGNTYTVTLNKGEIYQVLGVVNGSNGEDLTGSTIRSVASASGGCKRIAVFSGSGKISIGCSCSPGTSDNLYQQLYPKAAWGKKYLMVPSYARPNAIYRVVKSVAAANVYLNGNLIPAASFVNNTYYEFASSAPAKIESDQPVSVAQYFTSQDCGGNGSPLDPDMIILNPVEQNIDKVTLVSSNLVATNNRQHHLHIIIKNAGTALSSFKLDGVPVPVGSWSVHSADPAYSYIYLSNIAQGYHILSSDTGFNALAYGYADAESYGYSAGSSIKDLYQYVTVANPLASVDFPAACKENPFYLSISLPYQPTKIDWQFNGLFADITDNNPVFTSSSVVNGRTVYKYKIAAPFTTSKLGVYPIKVIAQNPTADGCGGVQEIDYDLEIFEKPVADFDFTTNGCVLPPTAFTDKSNSNGRAITNRYWNLGDGTIINDQSSITHGFAAGSYTVKYAIVTDIGCISDTAKKVVLVNDPPVAGFVVAAPYCQDKSLTFKDASTTTNGANIIKWTWNFGDGSPVIIANSNTDQIHSYTSAGNFTVTLIVESATGCLSTVFSKVVSISSNPQAKFTAPDICVNDLAPPFVDASTVAGGSITAWQWNFGDANASPGNPNITFTQNTSHHYSLPSNYTAQLIVTSNAGCKDTVQQLFSVNGAVVTPSFTIQNTDALCSNKAIVIKDASAVDAGNVVRVEIFWDATNDISNKTIDTDPVVGKLYTHNYPEFFAPASKTYTIRYDVYSGIICVNSVSKTITLLATPQLSFGALQPLCSNDLSITVNQGKIVNGLAGSGVYSGPGITATGLFDPAKAGAGTQTLTYTYSANNGCSNAIQQTIVVYPTPIANAGPDKFVLEGGFIQLTPTLITSIPVSYNWSPATWLDTATIPKPRTYALADITYKLTVTSDKGCKTSDDVFVKLLKTPVIPNIFSPNGDGINDKWVIQYLDSYPGCVVQIYNRYGQMVINQVNYTKAWDGKINGKDAPVGTYYYIIDPKNGRKPMTGYVDIIR